MEDFDASVYNAFPPYGNPLQTECLHQNITVSCTCKTRRINCPYKYAYKIYCHSIIIQNMMITPLNTYDIQFIFARMNSLLKSTAEFCKWSSKFTLFVLACSMEGLEFAADIVLSQCYRRFTKLEDFEVLLLSIESIAETVLSLLPLINEYRCPSTIVLGRLRSYITQVEKDMESLCYSVWDATHRIYDKVLDAGSVAIIVQDSEGDDCPVCLDETPRDYTKIAILPLCVHIFCVKCIGQWLIFGSV